MRFLPVLLWLTFAANGQAAQPRQVVAPDWSTCTMPVYPPAATASGEEGTTTLAILIGTDGAVRDSRIVSTSGNDELDEAARGADVVPFRAQKRRAGHAGGIVESAYVWSLK